MVFDIAPRRDRLRRTQSIVLALILLLAAARAGADTLSDLLRNTVGITFTRDGERLSEGVGLFLGTYEGKGLLLMPYHVVPYIGEIGNPASRIRFEIELAGSLRRYAYGESRLHTRTSDLKEAYEADYLVVELPVGHAMHAAISNLTREQFREPRSNEPVFIYSVKPGGGWTDNQGAVGNIRGKDAISFDIKTDKVIEKGESGSPILSLDQRREIRGILLSSDARFGKGVFPAKELDGALQTIGWSKDNREDLHGISLSVVPTYQYSSKVQDLGGGTTHTETQHGVYTSLELEYFRLTRPAGDTSASKLGLVAGYSGGSAHGLGQVDDADYTVKYGVIAGAVDRVKDNTGQVGLFALSHRVNGKFVTRMGVSFEAMTQLSVRSQTAFDLGFRLEINELSFSKSGGNSLGAGLVLRYSWYRAL